MDDVSRIVRSIQGRTRGLMPNTSKRSAGGRLWREYLAQAAFMARRERVYVAVGGLPPKTDPFLAEVAAIALNEGR